MKLLISHQYNSFVSQQERPQLPGEVLAEVGDPEKVDKDDVIDINVLSAALFVLLASAFLLILYFYMSVWFMRVLIILFCIGGFEVRKLNFLFDVPSHGLFLLSTPPS